MKPPNPLRPSLRFGISLTFVLLPALTAQTVTSVTNLASGDVRLSPGVLAVINGSGLGTSTSIPVIAGGKPAAVLIATATQLTVQLSYDVVPGLTTLTAGGSAPFSVTLSAYAPALFTTVTHGAGVPVGAGSPVVPGEVISLYATGLGPVSPAVTAGTTSPASPLSSTVVPPTVLVGAKSAVVQQTVLTPGQIGLYQVNVQLPADVPTGNQTVTLSIGGFTSNALTIPVGAALPTISGVVSATGIPGSVQPAIEGGSWVAIYGSNLSNTTTDWSGKVVNGVLPTSIGGVSVTIDGKAAYVYYVSPGQLDVQAPTASLGNVKVVVTNNGVSSAPATALSQDFAPAFFQWGPAKYAVATRYPDNAYISNPADGTVFVAAKPNDILTLWCTGFGPTSPLAQPGAVVSGSVLVARPVTVTVGGLPATVVGAAMSPGLAGVYQVAIQVPAAVSAGDVLVKASVGGFDTPDNVYLFVAK